MEVAPYAGAWIETMRTAAGLVGREESSPPTRGRGLKPLVETYRAFFGKGVAPYAGAWIETSVPSEVVPITRPCKKPPRRCTLSD